MNILFQVPGLTEGEEYQFRIKAVNDIGASLPSRPSGSKIVSTFIFQMLQYLTFLHIWEPSKLNINFLQASNMVYIQNIVYIWYISLIYVSVDEFVLGHLLVAISR